MKTIILCAGAALALAISGGASVARGGSYASHNLLAPGQHQIAGILGKKKAKPSDFAVVNSDGTVARGRNVASEDHIGTGIYIVHFTTDKTACAYTATVGLGGSSGTSPPGYATVVGAAADANGVFMDTYNSAGANTDLGYHLVTNC